MSGTIYGSFSGISSDRVRPYVTYSYTQNIVGNYSDVTVNLYFQSVSSYYGYGTCNDTTTKTEGDFNHGSVGFNVAAYGTVHLAGRTVRVYHNSDGTKSTIIGANGSTNMYWGSFVFWTAVTLPTIPRRATITTSNANLTIGNNKSYTLKNDGGLYVRMEYWIYGNAGWYRVKNQNNGTGTTGTFTMDSTDNNNMYSRMPNVLSASAIMRAYTYSDSGYSVQVGDYHDVNGTVSINQATNTPTFTTWTVANLDKNIVVKDKYENELITSSTSTLLGADTKALNGYSKVRATITSANKAVALNYATMSKYRFTAASKYTEANWSSDSTVNIDIDNVLTGSYSVRALDSRGLTKTVNNSLTLISPTPVSLWGLTLSRQNGVDTQTTMSFSGAMWKQYFGGGSSGVQNAVVCEWRYKETTESWAAQSWTTITGDLDIDANGNIAFEEVIEGDLGATGFDADKSFNIEVRIYDKVSQKIIEGTLNVGTPVMDITKEGVAFMGKYDSEEGGAIQVDGGNILPSGTVSMFAGSSAPTGYLLCDGSAVSRTTYANLFTAISTTYGSGDGSTTFNVPDLRGRVAVGYKSTDTSFDALGETGGAKTHALTTAELAQHRHTPVGDDSQNRFVVSRYTPSNQGAASGSQGSYWDGTGSANAYTGYAGSGTAHNNLQPYITLNYIIKV